MLRKVVKLHFFTFARFVSFSLIFPHLKKKANRSEIVVLFLLGFFIFLFYLLGIIFSFVERRNTVE